MTILYTETNKNRSCNLKILKYKFKKKLNIVKFNRNFEFEKRTDQKFVTQNLYHVSDYRIFEEKETVKNMSK